jgi:hypothetical protein
MSMTTGLKLEIVLDELDLAIIERAAHRDGQPIMEWIRGRLGVGTKLHADETHEERVARIEAMLRRTSTLNHPTGEPEQLREEILRGRYGD